MKHNLNLKRGFIYCLSNPIWEKDCLVKIGRTVDIDLRLNTIHTSLYEDCKIEFITEVVCCKLFERLLKDKLKEYRYRSDREFYKVPKFVMNELFELFEIINKKLQSEKLILEFVENVDYKYYKYMMRKSKQKIETKLFVDTCSSDTTELVVFDDKIKSVENTEEIIFMKSKKNIVKKRKGIYVDTSY